VVVPYDLEPPVESAGIEMQRIRVYDPNRPAVTEFSSKSDKAAKQKKDAELSVFTVRTGDGSWRYEWNDGESWDGIYFFTIPLTEYGYQEDWTLPGLGTLTGTIGIILGYAGVTADGELVNATDATGRTLFDDNGELRTGRLRPSGLRLVPGLAPGAPRKRIVALTGSGPVTFTVRPRRRAESTMFSLLFSGVSTTIEQVANELNIEIDPNRHEVRLRPTSGTASAIVRFTRRLDDTTATLSHALRVRGVPSERPFVTRLTADGHGVEIPQTDGNLALDLEVTHTSRIGQQRILECDDIAVPAGRSAKLVVSNTEALDKPGAMPLALSLSGPGGEETVQLGHRVTGPVVHAPHRVVAKAPRPTITIPGTRTNVSGRILDRSTGLQLARVVTQPGRPLTLKDPLFEVDVDVGRSSSGERAVRVRTLGRYRGEGSSSDGPLVLKVPPGTRPIQFVAEDLDGRRSFPRTVFLTVATPDELFHSPLTLFGDDGLAQPSETVETALGLYTTDLPVNRVVFQVSARSRVSGVGRERPVFSGDAFVAHPTLTGAVVTQTVGRGGFTLTVEVAWEAEQAKTGRFDLGVLRVALPPTTALGSTFRIESRGEVTVGRNRIVPVDGVPIMLRVWGGPEPTSLRIEGPSSVEEDTEGSVKVNAEGLPDDAANIGWWVETVSGRALVSPSRDPARATVRGERAGFVTVKVVVGTRTAEHLIRITPPPEGRRLTRNALEKLLPLLARQVSPVRRGRPVRRMPQM
jgi:hypothetical protein